MRPPDVKPTPDNLDTAGHASFAERTRFRSQGDVTKPGKHDF